MTTLLIFLTMVLVILIVRSILKLGGKVEREKTAPSEVAISAELGLDESHKLGNVMSKTWEYFDSHPGTDAATMIHAVLHDRACLVTENMDGNGRRVVTVSFIIDDDYKLPDFSLNAEGQPEAVIEGPGARIKTGEVIKTVLEISDESLVSYQLAGSGGPEHYFDFIRQ